MGVLDESVTSSEDLVRDANRLSCMSHSFTHTPTKKNALSIDVVHETAAEHEGSGEKEKVPAQ